MDSPVDLRYIQPWTCETGPSDTCKICRNSQKLSMTYEIEWIEEGAEESTYISEACGPCTRKLIARDPEMRTQKYWNQKTRLYGQLSIYGLLSEKWMTEKLGIDVQEMFDTAAEQKKNE